MTTAIDDFLSAIEAGTMDRSNVFTEEVLLDATVPDWRFQLRGADGVRAQLGRWYANPATFEALDRVEIPGGELVEFELSWTEAGLPFACHQVHRIRVDGDRVAGVTVFCGGRWSAARLAEMEEAARVAG